MGRRARVAFLVTGSGIGGAERQVADLALGMRSRGWDVAAISMLPQAETFDDLSAKGVMTVSLGMRQGFGIRGPSGTSRDGSETGDPTFCTHIWSTRTSSRGSLGYSFRSQC